MVRIRFPARLAQRRAPVPRIPIRQDGEGYAQRR